MNKSMLVGTVLGITAATAVAGFAGYSMLDKDDNRKALRPCSLVGFMQSDQLELI